MPSISFQSADIDFRLSNQTKISAWLRRVIKSESRSLEDLSYIFCSDEYLLKLNRKFLKHRTYTDIITFDYSEDAGSIVGEIYISIERVRENAEKYGVSFPHELRRVLVHGVLHLIGYSDKSPRQKSRMRNKEDACLSLYSQK